MGGVVPLNFPNLAGAARRHLAWAVAISLLLHLLLIAGTPTFDWGPPAEEASATLSARLAPLPRPVPETLSAPVTLPRPATRRPAAPPRTAAPEAPVTTPAVPIPSGEPSAAISQDMPPASIPAAPAPPEVVPQTPAPEPARAVMLPARAELQYTVLYGEGGFRAGRAVHLWQFDGERYRIRTRIEPVGIVSWFYRGEFEHESEGRLGAEGLRPEHYVTQRGRPDRMEYVIFDWDQKRATLSTAGLTFEAEAVPGTQDQVSFLHQLPFLLDGGSGFSMLIANGRRIERHEVQVMGEETVATGQGEFRALHLRRRGQEGSTAVDLWLAPELAHLPVKLRMKNRKGDIVEQVLSAAVIE